MFSVFFFLEKRIWSISIIRLSFKRIDFKSTSLISSLGLCIFEDLKKRLSSRNKRWDSSATFFTLSFEKELYPVKLNLFILNLTLYIAMVFKVQSFDIEYGYYIMFDIYISDRWNKSLVNMFILRFRKVAVFERNNNWFNGKIW